MSHNTSLTLRPLCKAVRASRSALQCHDLWVPWLDLDPFYLPAHIWAQALGYGSSFFDSGHAYKGTNDRVHGPGNYLETGPMMPVPQPWWW
jgi:hypothetical protein